MVALAVVGPICSGKSTVLRALSGLGAETCNADDVAKTLTEVGQPALQRVLAEFGAQYARSDGSLDRAALAKLIFNDRGPRERLEAILHPAILEWIAAWLENERQGSGPPPVAAVEVLRLPEHLGARRHFDKVWLCRAATEVRLSRLMARDGLSEPAAKARMDVQAAQGVEDCDPDLVLGTDGVHEQVIEQVNEAWQGLLGRVAK